MNLGCSNCGSFLACECRTQHIKVKNDCCIVERGLRCCKGAYIAGQQPSVANTSWILETSSVSSIIYITKASSITPPNPVPPYYVQVRLGETGFITNNFRRNDTWFLSTLNLPVSSLDPSVQVLVQRNIVGLYVLVNVGTGTNPRYTFAKYTLSSSMFDNLLQVKHTYSYPTNLVAQNSQNLYTLAGDAIANNWLLVPTGIGKIVNVIQRKIKAVYIPVYIPPCIDFRGNACGVCQECTSPSASGIRTYSQPISVEFHPLKKLRSVEQKVPISKTHPDSRPSAYSQTANKKPEAKPKQHTHVHSQAQVEARQQQTSSHHRQQHATQNKEQKEQSSSDSSPPLAREYHHRKSSVLETLKKVTTDMTSSFLLPGKLPPKRK